MTLRQRVTVVLGLIAVLLSAVYVVRARAAHEATQTQWRLPPTIARPPRLPEGVAKYEVRIGRGATIGKILADLELPVGEVLEASRSVYDLTKLRPDRQLEVVYSAGDPVPSAVRYGYDDDHTVVVERVDGVWKARLEAIEYDVAPGTREVKLTRSLWEDGLDAGLSPDDLLRLAAIFEYDVDFNTELADGAIFTIVADILTPRASDDATAPTGRTRLGPIHATRLVNVSKTLTAVHFDPPSGEPGYFHPDGSGMKRPFLRSPLEFSRVTSGFNPRRFHPILKTARPHNGTDFGAPTGTPVRAVADGVVSFAGRSGGHGNFVKIKHDSGYETSYSHLSRVNVRKGARIQQGANIGAVGSTGMSTGPHLHYQMWRAGRFVNPMTIDLPKTGSVPVSDRAAFDTEAQRWLPMLEAQVAGKSP